MGFATIWRKRRRLRLPIALQQAFLAKRMSNRLDLWRLLGDLGSNTLRRFDAIRYIRSRDFPHAALYILHRIATHLPEDAFSGGDLFDLMRSLREFLRLGHTPLDCRNQDLSGFLTSIDKDRLLAAWRLLLTWYRQRQPHSTTTHLTVDTLDTSSTTRVYNGRRRPLTCRSFLSASVPSGKHAGPRWDPPHLLLYA